MRERKKEEKERERGGGERERVRERNVLKNNQVHDKIQICASKDERGLISNFNLSLDFLPPWDRFN